MPPAAKLCAPAVASTAPEFTRSSLPAPLISIGIPCYNRPHFLAEALASIRRQTGFEAFDVVVSDDGALPENRRIVEDSGIANIRYYANRPALGAVANWNACIERAGAPWVTILHEDDLLYPWFLRAVAPRLRDEVVAVSVRCVQGETPLELAPPAGAPEARRYAPLWFLKASMTPFPGVVMSREVALRLGGFDAREGGLADYTFWYALACAGTIETLRVPAAFYRVSGGQWTEREWPVMLRRAHGFRLRVAREQLPSHRRLGRWLARFYTARMARSYARRFGGDSMALARARKLANIPFQRIPSGWVWALLKWLAPARR